MKTSKKVISLILALAMLLSCASLPLIASAAEIDLGDGIVLHVDENSFFNNPEENLIQAYVTDNGNANGMNAGAVLDFMDSVLATIQLDEGVEKIMQVGDLIGLEVNINSVDGICRTLDTAQKMSGALKKFGSLSLMNLDGWTKGQTRARTGDYTLLFNLIQVLCDNRALVEKLVNGEFTLKGTFINPDSLIGVDPPETTYLSLFLGEGIHDKLIGMLADLLDVEKAPLDKMIFEEFLPEKINDLLENVDSRLDSALSDSDFYALLKQAGFKLSGVADDFRYSSDMYTDEFFATIISKVWKKGVAEPFTLLLSTRGDEVMKVMREDPIFSPFVDLISFDDLDLDQHLDEMMDCNNVVGDMLTGPNGYFKEYTGWVYGERANLFGNNLQKLLMYLIDNRTVAPGGDIYSPYPVKSGDFMSYAMCLTKAIATNSGYTKLNDCNNLEEIIVNVIAEEVNGKTVEIGLGDTKRSVTVVVGKNSNTWEAVLGDVVGSLALNILPVYTDRNNTQKYEAGSGESIWDVLNYIFNYYFVDLNLDELLGLQLTKSQSALEKVEALQKLLYTGICPYTKAGQFYKTDVFENLINLNLGEFITAFEKKLLQDTASDTMASLLYQIFGNVFKGMVGTTVLTGNFVSLDAVISDSSIATIANNFLRGLKSRHSMLPVFDYVFATFLTDYTFEAKGTCLKICSAQSGTTNIAVYYGGKHKLIGGKDFNVTYKIVDNEIVPYIVGMGNFAGTMKIPSGITVIDHIKTNKTVKATTSSDGGTSIVCSKCGVTIAKSNVVSRISKVELSQTEYTYDGEIKKPDVTVKDSAGKYLVEGTDYTVKYSSGRTEPGVYSVTVTFTGKYSGTENLKFTVVPENVTGLTAAASGSTKINLTWDKVDGATGYRVYKYKSGKYTMVADVTSNSYKVTDLSSATGYTFAVKAMAKTASGTAFSNSYSEKVSASTKPSTPKASTSSSSTSKVKISWKAIKNADGYEVYYATSKTGTYKKLKTTTSTSYTKSGLTAGKTYYFKVRAYIEADSAKVYSAFSSVVSGTPKLSTPSIKVKSASKKATVSFGKITNASGYEIYYSTSKSGSYKKLTTTSKTSYTKSGLTKGKTYYFKVRAYKKVGSTKVYSAYSPVVSGKIK